ncbi:alanine racemase [Clostridioides difficile]|nr:amino-acid racemase [Clostridioides difficile]
MKISEIATPGFLLDLDQLEENINTIQQICTKNDKQLWPMLKTHKSTYIAKLQKDAGATGFLVGTLDEAEALINSGFKDIMLAYPYIGDANINRVVTMASKINLICATDNIECARAYSEAFSLAKIECKLLLIVDCGLHRFGIEPEKVVELATEISKLDSIKIVGISSHPGQVYGCSSPEGVPDVCIQEDSAMEKASKLLADNGFNVDIVASGSTPTVETEAASKTITAIRPGNYVYYDAIQIALGCATEKMCALTVVCTVISKNSNGYYLVDCGSKCLGLDKGAHGNSSIVGYGIVCGHPELIIDSLSEEVGKIKVNGETDIKIGDRIRIIPNHSCSTANLTSNLLGFRGDTIEKVIEVDIRENSKQIVL